MTDELILCSKCNGEGIIYNELSTKGNKKGTSFYDDYHIQICPKCQGHKKLDWIENIVGKKIPQFDIKNFRIFKMGGIICDGKSKIPDFKS